MDYTPLLLHIPKIDNINKSIEPLSVLPSVYIHNPSFNYLKEKKIELDIVTMNRNETTINEIVCDYDLYEQRNNLIDYKNKKLTPEIIEKVIPFTILTSNFKYKDAVKLANIDAILNVLPQKINNGSIPFYKTDGVYMFCDIGGGKGGFYEYMTFRFPDNSSFGTTSRDNEYDTKWLMRTRRNKLITFYGSNGSGNLLTIWDEFYRKMIAQFQEGCDFVSGNIEIDETLGIVDPLENEIMTSEFILIECMLGIRLTNRGRNFVCRMVDTNTLFSRDLLYLLSLAFEEVYLFKPITSNHVTEEKYVICKNATIYKNDIAEMLEKVVLSYNDDVRVVRIINDNIIPDEFNKTLYEMNNLFLQHQTEILNKINMLYNGDTISWDRYDTLKSLVLWNLPSNYKPSKEITK